MEPIVYQYFVGNSLNYGWVDALMFPVEDEYPTAKKPLDVYEKHTSSWDEMVEVLSIPEVSLDKELCSLFNLCEFNISRSSVSKRKDKKPSRCLDNILKVHGIILDYDGGKTFEEVKEYLKGLKFFAYTSFNNGYNKETKTLDPSIEKFRVVIPFVNPIYPLDIEERKEALKERFPGIDESTFDLSRPFFVYSFHPGRTKGWTYSQKGKEFDLNELPIDENNYEYLDEPVEFSSEHVEQYYNALKSMRDNELHHMDVFKFITYGKMMGCSITNLIEALSNKISIASSIYNNHDEITRLYSTAKEGSVFLNAIKSMIRKFGGNDQILELKTVKGVQKLRDIDPDVEDRFDNKEVEEDIIEGIKDFINNNISVLLSHEPGAGKTHIAMNICSKKDKRYLFDWFAYNKNNIDDVYNYLKSIGADVIKVLGRDNFCKHPIYQAKEDKNHLDHEIVKDIRDSLYCRESCEFSNECLYPKQFNKSSQFAVKHHSFLFNDESYWDKESKRKATHLIIDESVLGDGFDIKTYKLEKLPPLTKFILSPLNALSKKLNTIVELGDDKIYVDQLFESRQIEEDLPVERESTPEDLFNLNIRTSSGSPVIELLLNELNDLKAQNAQYFSQLAECGTNIEALRELYASEIKKPYSYTITKKLVDGLIEINQNNNNFYIAVYKDEVYLRSIKRYKRKWNKPKLFLDATPEVSLLPFKVKEYKKLSKWSDDLIVSQIYDKSFSKTELFQSNLAKETIEWFLKLLDNDDEEDILGIITYKRFEAMIRTDVRFSSYIRNGKLILGHFGGTKGSNDYNNCRSLIICGQYRENPLSIYNKACIKWRAKPNMSKESYRKGVYKLRNGKWREQSVGYRVYSDSNIQLLADIAETNEMLQNIGRIRASRVEIPKNLLILTSIPKNIPINKLTTWNELSGKNSLKRELQLNKESELVYSELLINMMDGKPRDRVMIEQEIIGMGYGMNKARKIFYSIQPLIADVCTIEKIGSTQPRTYYMLKKS